jgi:hypothetical protein
VLVDGEWITRLKPKRSKLDVLLGKGLVMVVEAGEVKGPPALDYVLDSVLEHGNGAKGLSALDSISVSA